MEEANHRVLRPYRQWLPTPDWFKFRSRMGQLNAYLINLFRSVGRDISELNESALESTYDILGESFGYGASDRSESSEALF